MKILILDDRLVRLIAFTEKFGEANTLVLTCTVGECIEQLRIQDFHLICLDHDLGGQQMVKSGKNTGYEVACWLAENKPVEHTPVVIHSFNTVGAQNMYNVMKAANMRVIINPGYWNEP